MIADSWLTLLARGSWRAAWPALVVLACQGVAPAQVRDHGAVATALPPRPATQANSGWRQRTRPTRLQREPAVRAGALLDSARVSELFARRVAAVADRVRARSDVPVRLPLVFYAGLDDDSLYVVLTEVGRGHYEGVFASRPECEGGNSCRDGSFEGRRLTHSTRPPRGPSVVLAGGQRGTFTPARCATFCSDAFVTWDEGAYRFRLGMKAGRLEDLQRVASAVVSR